MQEKLYLNLVNTTTATQQVSLFNNPFTQVNTTSATNAQPKYEWDVTQPTIQQPSPIGNQANYDLDIKFREIFGNKYPTRIDPSKLVWGNGIIASAEYLNYIAFFYNNEAIGNEPNNSISLSDGSFGGAVPVYNLKTGWIIGYSYNQSGIDKFVKF